ncbi:TolC family protein [Nitrospira moscoviensis]|uniref:Putative Outer membrane efflux protein n=1 Tax=Nitrospira moscoviensis TaxID=42253 RepID=A0A0K2GI97_NITMO|nr:TolC family protein [Nitrospira moscoviensis]ALA60670.1 putative Outer membrane efflux protein [Nitrospira moscoviensis]
MKCPTVLAVIWLVTLPLMASAAPPVELVTAKPLPAIPLSLDEIHAWVDRSHPLLKGAGTEKVLARGKMLKALGAFEPTLINDTELERFISSSNPQSGTQTVGFNDTLIEARHPWGFRGSAGYRRAIGDARIPDLSFGENNQLILGGFFPLLRGLMTNPENAELQRSELADPRADVKIAQTRQDLFLAAASQFWDWVAANKFVDVQKRALTVAEDRYKQVEGRAKAGAVAPLDVVEAGQEVQRRREVAIAAQRAVEQEQFKLSMFLWENGAPTLPPVERVPDFPAQAPAPPGETVKSHKILARQERPEVKEVDIEAKINNIDLALAKNNLLPSLDAEAAPARAPEKFVLGLGYRFGLELKVPLLQRRSRGEVLEAQAQADRLVLVQKFREQQVMVDVDNALSAIERAKERMEAAAQSLRLAKTLEDGERFRFSLGATSVLFVNLRERNTVDSEIQVIRAKADYQKALALYQWAIGAWAKSLPSAVPVTYRARD